MDEIFRLLWMDISLKISKEYAKELYYGYMEICYRIKNALDLSIGQINTVKALLDISGRKDLFRNGTLFLKIKKESWTVLLIH